MNPVDATLKEIEEWRSGRVWGRKRIARLAGVHPDTIPAWAMLPDCPIKQIGGRYFTMRDALITWLTAK